MKVQSTLIRRLPSFDDKRKRTNATEQMKIIKPHYHYMVYIANLFNLILGVFVNHYFLTKVNLSKARAYPVICTAGGLHV